MKDYYVGIDEGTDWLGWAVTDENYNILKFKGNAMWGIRHLAESHTAEERRRYRSARRRLQRKKFRLQCLEMLFDKEISKIDISFFQRLKESSFYPEDKKVAGRYSLFNDDNYTDRNYHEDYPTIYHLRKALLENKKTFDVRLVYLAVSHIVKNRGHFLFDSDSLGKGNMPEFSQVWNELSVWLYDNMNIQLDCSDISAVQDILKSKTLSITKKKEALAKEFSVGKKDEPCYSILSLLAGATVNSHVIFDDEELKSSEVAKITFSSGYDDKVSLYESIFGDSFELIERLKAVYDWAVLANILNNGKNTYLSCAKVAVYEKHREDLAVLKKFVKEYIPDKKNLIFNVNENQKNNYLAYSGHNLKGSVEKKCTQQEFLDFLRKQLPKANPSEEYTKMYNEIELGVFLPKIVGKDNSAIPMQVNKAELVAILKNASEYLPFLTEQDKDGKTVSEKILDIFSFRIPYYVGPLNNNSGKYWIVRKDEKIYPWNFNQVVDIDASAEKFIENLTSKCTYLKTEDVLPKNSLLYSKFMVLNELNNLKFDGQKITVEQKQAIYNDLFITRNKVTLKAVSNYIKSKFDIKDVEITGIDGDFKSNLKVYRDFQNYNLTEDEKEEVIKAITIFGDDKKLLKKRLKNHFSSKLTDEDIKAICKLKYTGWGKLSKKLLAGIKAVDKENKELNSIIGFMWDTNNNLVQVLLSKNYKFLEVIKKENGPSEFTSLSEEVENLYVSPKVKRPIYQTMKIVEEIVKIKGYAPKKIFVEVARGADENMSKKSKDERRKVSRKNKLIEIYKKHKLDNLEIFKKLKKTDDKEFRRDALYLYYTQMGKCMYTGQAIEVEDIINGNLYDVDHIFPKSKIKDDSLDNRVLSSKDYNENVKKNIYPINQNTRRQREDFWKTLLSYDLISKKKYERLMRNEPLTDDELSAFIDRQMVETRQSTKAIAQLLEKRYSTDVVYVKAKLVSYFRKKFDFAKSRDVNDLHHAKDAYLSIVVGNVYDTCFTRNKANFIKGLQLGTYSLNRMYDYDVENAWIAEEDNKSIDVVNKMMKKNNIRFTCYSSKKRGRLFEQTILKKKKGKVSIKCNSPISDVDKYGGYSGITCTYFALAGFLDKKGNRLKALVPINLHNEKEYLEYPVKYIEREIQKINKGARNIEIVDACVKINTLISLNGFRMHISGKYDDKRLVCNSAVQLILSNEQEKYIKKISRYIEKCKELRTQIPVTEFKGINAEGNMDLYSAIKDKLNNSILNVKFDKLGKALIEKEKLFADLSISEQCCVILELLRTLRTNAVLGDLRLIKETNSRIRIGSVIKKSKDVESFKIIHQSITGLFEQEIELLD